MASIRAPGQGGKAHQIGQHLGDTAHASSLGIRGDKVRTSSSVNGRFLCFRHDLHPCAMRKRFDRLMRARPRVRSDPRLVALE